MILGLILPSKIVFDKKYKLKNGKYNFNKNSHFFKLLETEIKHDFSIYGRLKIKSDIYYKYNNLNLDHH